MIQKKPCPWPGDDFLYIAYHDEEWGPLIYEDQPLFVGLLLDGAQVGLSWITILCERNHYDIAFCIEAN